MDNNTYTLLENYMLSCMEDSAHDKDHIYRVLYNALEIAEGEDGIDYDVLVAACLLHDIGRREQLEDPALCHAQVGGEKAYSFLLEHGFEKSYAQKVRHCIQTHRYRKTNTPQSIEAKILFDADKLDVTGALGIARTLVYLGGVSGPLYSLLPDGSVSNGENDTAPSFFREYKYKLEKLYSMFYTAKGAALAKERQHNAVAFYEGLYGEVCSAYEKGKDALRKVIQE